MYGPPTFDCKCVICGTKKNFTEADIDAVLGPCCPKCYGPMITERVNVRSMNRRSKTKFAGES